MFILTAWGNQRELICHKESNTTRRRTPRGACQCTLCSYSPGVKSLWDDPQNTLLRSMQHAQSSPRVGMGQDTFHRQLSAPTPPWYTSEDTNRSYAVRLSIKTAYTNIQRFRLTKVALCVVCTMIKYMTKNHSNVSVDKRWNCAVVQQDIATFSNLRYPHGYEATCNSHHDSWVFMRQHSLCGTLWRNGRKMDCPWLFECKVKITNWFRISNNNDAGRINKNVGCSQHFNRLLFSEFRSNT